MAILTTPKLSPQQRLDLEDWNTLLSSLRTDSKFWTTNILSEDNLIFKGFTVSGIGLTSATVSMVGATLIVPENSGDFSFFTASTTEPNIIVTDAQLTDNTRNYLEIELCTEDNTPLSKAFWNPDANSGNGEEFNSLVNTVTDLKANVVVESSGFSGNPDRIPLAIIDTDANGQIQIILDRRNLFGRLSTPSDLANSFSWTSKTEPTYQAVLSAVTGTFVDGESVSIGSETATVSLGGTTSITFNIPSGSNFSQGDVVTGSTSGATGTLVSVLESFSGADKSIPTIHDLFKALMTEIRSIKGTSFWYEDAAGSLDGVFNFLNSVIAQQVVGARYEWDGSSLSITDSSVTPLDSDALGQLKLFGNSSQLNLTRQDSNSSPLNIAEDEVLYIKIPATGDRSYSGLGTADDNYQVENINTFVSNNENYWIAYRKQGLLYIRGYGEMEAGESSPISDPDKETILNLIDQTNEKNNQDRTGSLVEGGTWSFSNNTLVNSADAFVSIPGLTLTRNTVATQSISLPNANSVAYVEINRESGAANTLTVSVADLDSITLTDNIVVIARRVPEGVLLGSPASFVIADGEFLTLAGALQEVNRYFGQLRIQPKISDPNRVIITGADIAKLNGTTLSQSIRESLLDFEGAEIDVETGTIYSSDGITPINTSFTPPTVAAGQFRWIAVTIQDDFVGANNTASGKVQVTFGSTDGSTAELAPRANFDEGIRLGQFFVQRNAGDTEFEPISYSNIVQLGIGSGNGSGAAVTRELNIPAHGLIPGNQITGDDTNGYERADASDGTKLAIYTVIEVRDPNTVVVQRSGIAEIISHGFTPGQTYFSDPSNPGEVTITDPNENNIIGEFSVPAFLAISANLLEILNDVRPAVVGTVPNLVSDPVGKISIWPDTTIPADFLRCEGQAVSRIDYADLFGVIGEKYGSGDGITTFNLPDYRGYFLRGVDGLANRDNGALRTDRGDGTTGNEVGTIQSDSTKLPNNGWGVSSSGGHRHSSLGASGLDNIGTTGRYDTATIDGNGTFTISTSAMNLAGDHVHSITGGDGETSPENVYVYFIIRAKNPAVTINDFTLSIDATTGSADSGKVILTNTNGLLDPSFLGTTATTLINTTTTIPVGQTRNFLDTTGGGFIVNLPDANVGAGTYFEFRKQSSDYNIVTLSGPNGESFTVATQGEVVRLESDGTLWFLYSRSINSDLGDYIPVIGAISGETSVDFKITREGRNLYCVGRFTAGTVGATRFSISIPSGLQIDGAYFNNLGRLIGYAGRNVPTDLTNNYSLLNLPATSSTEIYMGLFGHPTEHPLEALNGNQLISNGSIVSVVFRVPILGWEG